MNQMNQNRTMFNKEAFFIATFIFVFILSGSNLFAQETENELQSRANVELSYKPIKKLKFTLTPEIRFDEDFSFDEYLIQGEVEYKAFKFLSVGARYGFLGKIKETKDNEYFNRYALYTTYKQKLDRFKASFRLMYSNYADDEVNDKSFLRYKLGLKYDIPNSKITPYVSAQLFHDTENARIFKTRYALGLDYKLFKNNYLGIDYKFDYYNTEYLNRHIISLGYKIKL